MKKLLFILLLLPALFFGQATGFVISNKPSGGSIGTAASTVDILTTFSINQTTAGQTLTVPNLTNASASKFLYISNTGSTSFTLSPGGLLLTGTGATLRWTGAAWSVIGIGSSSGGGGVSGLTANNFPYAINSTTFGASPLYRIDATNLGLINGTHIQSIAPNGGNNFIVPRFYFDSLSLSFVIDNLPGYFGASFLFDSTKTESYRADFHGGAYKETDVVQTPYSWRVYASDGNTAVTDSIKLDSIQISLQHNNKLKFDAPLYNFDQGTANYLTYLDASKNLKASLLKQTTRNIVVPYNTSFRGTDTTDVSVLFGNGYLNMSSGWYQNIGSTLVLGHSQSSIFTGSLYTGQISTLTLDTNKITFDSDSISFPKAVRKKITFINGAGNFKPVYLGAGLSLTDSTLAATGGTGTVTSIATTSPITGGTITGTGTIAINNSAADGSTKGAASFTANDFDATSGNISIDYTNGQKASVSVPGFVSTTTQTFLGNKTIAGALVDSSETIQGTYGNGFLELKTQVYNPSAPSSGTRIFSNSNSKLSWRGSSNNYVKTFDGVAATADRVYSLPDKTMTVADAADVTALATRYTPLMQSSLSLVATQAGNTYFLAQYTNGATVMSTNSAANTLIEPQLIYIAAADYPTVNGVAPMLRIRAGVFVNHVAPTGNFTFGLYPMTCPASSGGAGVHSWTIGTVVTGSNGATQTTPAADTHYSLVSSDFALPADGWYAICVLTTSTIATASYVEMTATLQLHNQ